MISIKGYTDELLERGLTTRYCLDEKIWVNGVGDELYIPDMTTDHINNCISFLVDGYYMQGAKKIPVPNFYKGHEKEFTNMFKEELKGR